MTDQQLQLALAKMLPEKIEYYKRQCDDQIWWWKYEYCKDHARPVRDTEWLHVCWLVEQTFNKRERDMFANYLGQLVDKAWIDFGATRVVTTTKVVSASWQQRAEALCKVKGITP